MSNENSEAKPYFPDEEDFRGIAPEIMAQGRKIKNWDTDSCLRSTSAENDGEPDDVIFASMALVPVFSLRLRAALAGAGIRAQDVQYLPVRIFQSTGMEIRDFAIANVVSRIAALDRDKCFMLGEMESEIDPLTERLKISSIFTIAVRAELLNGHDMVRLVEFSPAVLVSERFYEIFRQGKFTGAICSPVISSSDKSV